MIKKTLHPKGTRVIYSKEWYGKVFKHDGHKATVEESEIKRVNGRNYYKYVLACDCGVRFKAEDRQPDEYLKPIQD